MEKYQVLKPIGKGSYGDVFLVRHLTDRKQYVLKKIFIKKSSKEKVLAQQEVKLLSELHHPNIVEYKDSFLTDKGQYMCIVMAFCEGGDLFTRLKAQNKKYLNEKQIIDWFVQIALALHYLHQRRILHRDLKTQNTFLTKNGIIKLGDFGIARVMENSMDMAKTMIGTPYYMSPELFDNKPYNYKSDVWALGCCVYEMTALRHAFDAKEMPTLIMKILKENPPPIPSHYSSELSSIIKLMLTKNTAQRPSVADLLQLPFIKSHMQASVQDHRSKVPDAIVPAIPPQVAPVPSSAPVAKKVVSNDVNAPLNKIRNKIADELSHEEELQKKLELKLKKLEVDLKSDRSAPSERKSRPSYGVEKRDDRKVVDKDKQEVKIVGSKAQVNELPFPIDRRNVMAKKEEVKREPAPKSSGVDKREKERKEIVTPRNPAPKVEPKKEAATPRSAPPSRGKETPRQKLVSVSSKDKAAKKSPSPPVQSGQKNITPAADRHPSPRVGSAGPSPSPIPSSSTSASPSQPVSSSATPRGGTPSRIPRPVQHQDPISKMDAIASRAELDLFSARIASIDSKKPEPKKEKNGIKPQKVDEGAVDEFPVIECSHSPTQDDIEEDVKVDKITAKLRESTIRINKIKDELVHMDQAEEKMEMEEVISIYDSYVKNGVVNDVPEDDEIEDANEAIFMTGNLSERINNLRQYCIDGLGKAVFEKVYNLMQNGSNDEDTLETQVENLIGGSKMYYFNYVRQIIFCELSLD